MAGEISTVLASQALAVSGDIFDAHLQPADLDSYRTAGDVAVKLHLISRNLSTIAPYWIGNDVEELCYTIWHLLLTIRNPSSKISPSSSKNSLKRRQAHIVDFFKKNKKESCELLHACNELYARLNADSYDSELVPGGSALELLESNDFSDNLADAISNALELIAECEPKSHTVDSAETTSEDDKEVSRHPVRLSLHGLGYAQTMTSPETVILVSSMKMDLWQEICLTIRTGNLVDETQDTISRQKLCNTMARDLNTRLHISFSEHRSLLHLEKWQALERVFQPGYGESLANVLRYYNFTPKDKVKLAYTVARSHWKFYGSKLMQTRWTSNTLWFMSEQDSGRDEGRLPLRAYFSLPDGKSNENMPDILYDQLVNHRCPSILDIAVLLLEIGQAKPFPTIRHQDAVGRVNAKHRIAIQKLSDLRKTKWDGFVHKKHYDQAVEFCLDKLRIGISQRRKAFQKNVVLPLAWLAKQGFAVLTDEVTYVNQNRKFDASQQTVPQFNREDMPEALFHSHIVPNQWLGNLRKISDSVEKCRRNYGVNKPVRIAILDTGLDKTFRAFQANKESLESIVREKDFVDLSGSTMTDTFGHGTFMARLIMECAPNVEILVARVAADTSKLETSKQNIAQAIHWADEIGKADIISMSFGLPKDDHEISTAIETVQKNRRGEIIFFASAGNSSSDDESFPARHPAVISVYATNSHGVFLQTNAMSTMNGANMLGTYGSDLPGFICDEFEGDKFERVCQPGSSVATAIMAGFSATLLAYAPALRIMCSTAELRDYDLVFQHIRTTKGMERVLHELAISNPGHQRSKAII